LRSEAEVISFLGIASSTPPVSSQSTLRRFCVKKDFFQIFLNPTDLTASYFGLYYKIVGERYQDVSQICYKIEQDPKITQKNLEETF